VYGCAVLAGKEESAEVRTSKKTGTDEEEITELSCIPNTFTSHGKYNNACTRLLPKIHYTLFTVTSL